VGDSKPQLVLTEVSEDLLELMIADSELQEEVFLSPRDYACVLLDFDYEAQVLAVRNLLRRNTIHEERTSEEIRDLEIRAQRLTGIANEWAVNEWIDRIHGSVYQDAAHSMAAVGMLAPLIESIFSQAFLSIKRYFPLRKNYPSHQRWILDIKEEWNCHYVLTHRKKKDVAEGIWQLADAVGLAALLPAQTEDILKALFTYRNRMFHNGFEWPIEERRRFEDLVKKWPASWFQSSKTDEQPWVFYLSDSFISECMSLIEETITALGHFAKKLNRP
jgi:hypothetical protein